MLRDSFSLALLHMSPRATALRLDLGTMRSSCFRLSTLLSGLLIAVSLAGCAAGIAYREGKDLVAEDKVEAGLAKFQEALSHEPRNAEYKAAYVQTRERAITNYLIQADQSFANGNRAEATRLYQRVIAIDANNERARTGLRNLEIDARHAQWIKEAEVAIGRKDFGSAESRLSSLLSENPNNEAARALRLRMIGATKPPVESLLSAAYKKPISIEFKDVSLKQVFEVISRTSGLNFLFDKDVKTDQKTSIFLKNSTIESAVHFTLLTNQLERQVLDANTMLIYPNTATKVKDYQEMVVKTFFLSNADAKAVAATMKTILKSRDVVVDEKLNMLILRDSPEAIRLAEKLVALHDVPEPEVMLEVEILEVKRTRLLELGIRWPSSLTLTPLSRSAATGGATTGGAPLTLNELRQVSGSSLGAGIGPITINARKEDSDANLLANPRIRVRNREKAKILIGERVPNITTTATSTGFVSESINYIDVGLTLNVEPTIHLDNDVAIKISLEVSNIVSQLATQSGSVAYQLGTRTASTVLRLKDGENQVLAGLINDEDRRTGNKVPGLGELPIVGRLFGSSADDRQKTEIVLSITPHLIRNIQRPEASLSEFRSGTETNFRIRPDSDFTPATAVVVPPASSPVIAQNAQQPSPPLNTNSTTGRTNSPATAGNAPASINPIPSGNVQLLWQGPSQVKVGETFTRQLTMQSDQPITGVPMAISFDNQILQVVSVVEGDFLKQGNVKTSFTSRVNPNGQILMTGTRSGPGGATSSGSIATITFKALAPAEASRLQLLTVTPTVLDGRPVVMSLPAPQAVRVVP
ncbi:cohesin domain-containing protein [Polaromonas sp.]|uniref:cohesin domain-containing protein n=1 Tax=Polaromonas sp. TaxID=1869339 RepID=UPI003266E884